ncbi:D-erythronate dehydrogenase [Oceaniglobus indicus]|uniref:D-erythronate dehydrogenase n=1 Tax=Oceaniglobus indicus TaxID=2047749 RepID=UPI000C17D1D2|nr:D-erythronate dehydrogenase [Oceaniglobus indicus]
MHVMIIGAAGMIGRKLADAIAQGRWPGTAQPTALTLVDVVEPTAPDGLPFQPDVMSIDLSQKGAAETLVKARADIIVHLAAIVSGEAEADFDKGYAINLDGTRDLFEAVRHAHNADGYTPRMVFTSSLAVFGAPFPDLIPDSFNLTPLTSYGTQKAIGELLLEDYTRRGFFDGIALRLPTICIRPGLPNKAASGFFSGILREPLNGKEAVLPVDRDVRHFFASPRAAVGFLLHACTMDTAPMGHKRALTMPGLSATVAEQIEALRRAAGEETAALIRDEPDATIAGIVAGWPQNFDTTRAQKLGFQAEASFDEIIAIYREDEMGTGS